jgi:hypothetical protein
VTTATERLAALEKQLETARWTLQDIVTRRETERARRQQEMHESERFFEGLCAKRAQEVVEIEQELKSEVGRSVFISLC